MRSIFDILDARAVRPLFQPLVDLRTGEVVGYEALARGPHGTQWERPDVLFAAARDVGRLAELDWICRAAAYRGALAADLPRDLVLFVNTEPEALGAACPEDLLPVVDAAAGRLRVVTEMTERSLTRDPAGLLAAADQSRQARWGVALDDVGAEPASLALMPFVHPDVVKLDLRLVQQTPGAETAAVVSAVLAHAERTGALILAEGIETEEHRQRALAMGATLGQGWLLGRPGPLPERIAAPRAAVTFLPPPSAPQDLTPYELVAGGPALRTASKSLLLSMSMHLERRALTTPEPPVVLSTFQNADYFTDASAARYDRLTHRSALVAAIGVGIPPFPFGEVRGAELRPDDPLRHEWDVVTVGPHHAAALIARDLGDSGPEGDRRFSYVLTHDREVVVQAARSLLRRVVASVGSRQLSSL